VIFSLAASVEPFYRMLKGKSPAVLKNNTTKRDHFLNIFS